MLLDLTRLMRRMFSAGLSGVDRVELAYARRYVVEGEAEACVRLGSRLAVIPRAAALRFIGEVEAVWRDADRRGRDRGLAAFEAAVDARMEAGGRPAGAGSPRVETPALRFLAAAALGALAPSRAPARPRLYLNVAHSGLERPAALARFIAAGRLAPVFFIHDLIPITHAEYARPGQDRTHETRIRAAIAQGRLLLANSIATRQALDDWAASQGLKPPPTVVAPLGVEDEFFNPCEPLHAARPYFVCLGTIEPRKNHLLLLNVWRAMAEGLGPACPILALVGRRGWESEQVHDMTERCRPLANRVFELSDLADDHLRRLIVGARALLFPSFVEGYGLPLLEAAALGAPVIASDIPAFREVGSEAPERLDPLDGPAWRAAIEAYAAPHSERRARQLAALARAPAPPRWADHFATVDLALAKLAGEAGDLAI